MRSGARDPYRRAIALTLVVVAILGLASKAYRGRFDGWINNYSGGVLSEIFWILLATLIWPAANPLWATLAVFLNALSAGQLNPVTRKRAQVIGTRGQRGIENACGVEAAGAGVTQSSWLALKQGIFGANQGISLHTR